jgi:hypothetical protein
MRSLRFHEVECEDDTHEGNGILGDTLTACPDCEEAAQDAYDDYRESRYQDEGW